MSVVNNQKVYFSFGRVPQLLATLLLAYSTQLFASPGMLLQTYNSPNGSADPYGKNSDNFGWVVAGYGSDCLVSSIVPGSRGAVYRYSSSSSALVNQVPPPTPPPTTYYFGASISSFSNLLAIGAEGGEFTGDPGEISYKGSVELYQSATDLNPKVFHSDAPSGYSNNFGSAVSLNATRLLVGEPYYSSVGASYTGKAHVFDPASTTALQVLTCPDRFVESRIGHDVVNLEDGSFAIGAPGAEAISNYPFGDKPTTGGVYIYNGISRALVHRLTEPDGLLTCHFGKRLAALQGNRLVVAAPKTEGYSGKVHVYDVATGTKLRTFISPAPGSNHIFGFAIATLNQYVMISATGEGRVYVFNADTGALVMTLMNPQGGSFGSSVAAVDGNILVGAWGSSAPGTFPSSGQAFLFAGPDAPNTPPDSPGGLDASPIGSSQVKITFTDNSSNEAGFELERRSGSETGFTQIATLGANQTDFIDSGLTANQQYCYRVRAQNIDGDSVYTPEACATTLSRLPGLVAEILNPGAPGDRFGFSVAPLSIGKGKQLLIVGAPGYDDPATSSGCVYIMDPAKGTVVRQIKNPSLEGTDEFGFSVASLGKFVLVGVPFRNGGSSTTGVAYVFDGETGGLVYTLNVQEQTDSLLGFSISGFGTDKILVGAPGSDRGGTDAGAVLSYDLNTGFAGGALQRANPQPGDEFGTAIAGSGDMFAATAPFANIDSAHTGGTFLLASDGTEVESHYGGSALAAIPGRVLVGATEIADPIPGIGESYLLQQGHDTKTVLNPTGDAGAEFGAAVTLTKSKMLIGAPRANVSGVDAGQVYLFAAKSAKLQRIVPNPEPGGEDAFGKTVTFVGKYMAIGAPLSDARGKDSGAVYLFKAK